MIVLYLEGVCFDRIVKKNNGDESTGLSLSFNVSSELELMKQE